MGCRISTPKCIRSRVKSLKCIKIHPKSTEIPQLQPLPEIACGYTPRKRYFKANRRAPAYSFDACLLKRRYIKCRLNDNYYSTWQREWTYFWPTTGSSSPNVASCQHLSSCRWRSGRLQRWCHIRQRPLWWPLLSTRIRPFPCTQAPPASTRIQTEHQRINDTEFANNPICNAHKWTERDCVFTLF